MIYKVTRKNIQEIAEGNRPEQALGTSKTFMPSSLGISFRRSEKCVPEKISPGVHPEQCRGGRMTTELFARRNQLISALCFAYFAISAVKSLLIALSERDARPFLIFVK